MEKIIGAKKKAKKFVKISLTHKGEELSNGVTTGWCCRTRQWLSHQRSVCRTCDVADGLIIPYERLLSKGNAVYFLQHGGGLRRRLR